MKRKFWIILVILLVVSSAAAYAADGLFLDEIQDSLTEEETNFTVIITVEADGKAFICLGRDGIFIKSTKIPIYSNENGGYLEWSDIKFAVKEIIMLCPSWAEILPNWE